MYIARFPRLDRWGNIFFTRTRCVAGWKVVFVTGSGCGLGPSYAQELARRGAAIVINGVDADVANAAAASITEAGEVMPEFFRKTLGFGTADDVVGLIAFLASDAAGNITGQVIDAGGGRSQLWSHREVVATEFHDGGWDYATLNENFQNLFGDKFQSVGERFPELPAELQPAPAAK